MERTFGYRRAEVVGRPLAEAHHSSVDARAVLPRPGTLFGNRERASLEQTNRDARAARRWHGLSRRIIHHAHSYGRASGLHRSSSRHFRTEAAGTRIAATNPGADRGRRRKNEFLAILSHELRNPLAPIRNAVEPRLRACVSRLMACSPWAITPVAGGRGSGTGGRFFLRVRAFVLD
jgi:signal transduction histidine kinase